MPLLDTTREVIRMVEEKSGFPVDVGVDATAIAGEPGNIVAVFDNTLLSRVFALFRTLFIC